MKTNLDLQNCHRLPESTNNNIGIPLRSNHLIGHVISRHSSQLISSSHVSQHAFDNNKNTVGEGGAVCRLGFFTQCLGDFRGYQWSFVINSGKVGESVSIRTIFPT